MTLSSYPGGPLHGDRYHHGDLRQALLGEARSMLRDAGMSGMSLRRLAERVGVSRTAPYHHFRDKNALLCALAAEGFERLGRLVEDAHLEPDEELEQGLAEFVHAYLRFAAGEPELYELMFGHVLWKTGQPTEELRQVAFACFRRYAERVATLFQHVELPAGTRPLRLAQASWATLHGLCRLLIDGIYVHREDMEEVSEEAVRLILAILHAPH